MKPITLPTIAQEVTEFYKQDFYRLFQTTFDTGRWIDYDESWDNGTGYFDHAVKLVKLEPGEVACSFSADERRLLLIGTRFGNVVVFERYSNSPKRLVMNVSDTIRRLFVIDNFFDEATAPVIFGCGRNIGLRIEDFFKSI